MKAGPDRRSRPDGSTVARRPSDSVGERARADLDARFEVGEREGSAGFWTVHAAVDRDAGRSGFLSLVDRADLDDVTELAVLDSAERGSRLRHPHVVRTVAFGTGTSFLWTWWQPGPLVFGTTPVELRSPVAIPRARRLLRQACAALHHAHRAELAHGALCPSTVRVHADDRLVLTPFGVDAPILRQRARAGKDPGEIGRFADPDVRSGGKPTPSGDQHALAALAVHWLSGEDPDAASVGALELPEPSRRALLRALERDPAARHPDVEAFLTAFEAPFALAERTAAPRGREAVTGPATVLVPAPPERTVPARGRPSGTASMGTGVALAAVAVLAFGARNGWIQTDEAETSVAGSEPAVPYETRSFPPPDDRLPAGPTTAHTAATDTTTTGTATTDTASAPPATADDRPRVDAPVSRDATRTGSAAETPPRPAPTPTATPPEASSARPERQARGTLFINSYPWGTVFLDTRRIGNTPIVGLEVEPGTHDVMIKREGYESHFERIDVFPGEEIRLTSIVLARSGG